MRDIIAVRPRRASSVALGLAVLLASFMHAVELQADAAMRALALVNSDRAAEGLRPMIHDPALSRAASEHAEDMLRRATLSHIGGDGIRVVQRMRRAGARWRMGAENVAYCGGCRPDEAQIIKFQRDWMQSPGHRANILHRRLGGFGYGIAVSGTTVFVVQVFGGPPR